MLTTYPLYKTSLVLCSQVVFFGKLREQRHFRVRTCVGILSNNPRACVCVLQDGDFRRLTFTAMLAWQRPYLEDLYSSETNNLPVSKQDGCLLDALASLFLSSGLYLVFVS